MESLYEYWRQWRVKLRELYEDAQVGSTAVFLLAATVGL